MIKLWNFKHIFAIIGIVLILISSSILLFSKDFQTSLNYFFIYRSGCVSKEDFWKLDRHWDCFDRIYKHHKVAPSDQIVMVEVDEKTINQLQAYNETAWLGIKKSDYQKVLQTIIDDGAKSVGVDIVFQNPDKQWEKEFANFLTKNQNIVIAIANSHIDSAKHICQKDKDSEIMTCPGLPRSIYKNAHWWAINFGSGLTTSTAQEKRSVGFDLAKSPEIFSMKFDSSKNFGAKDGWVFTMPVEMLRYSDSILLNKLTQNINSQLIQPYYPDNDGDDNSDNNDNTHGYITISFIKILENPEDYEWVFDGKYVFIWESGQLLHDTFVSPATAKVTPWVYSHAFLLDNFLQWKILEKLNENHIYILFIFIIFFTVPLYFYLPKFIAPIFFVFSFAVTIFCLRYFYDNNNLIIDSLPIILASGIISYPTTYIYKFFIVEKDKRLVVNTFSRYLSPSVVKLIDTKQINATLGWEKKELSILFSDIAGFTTISEQMDTKELFVLMTKYLSKMTDILTNNRGTLDKYIGDAVMWFFGAPVDDPNHSYNACKTAIEMQKALPEINKQLVQDGYTEISFRVGIATGEVMVGNIGSEKRFNYTVLGDDVNLASRLEAMGKEYGVKIIIASSTRAKIGDNFLVRELDYIAVKWKNSGTRIFELLGMKDDEIDMSKYSKYETALRLYRENKFLEAGKIFEENMEIDPPSKVMAYRCLEILKWNTTLDNGIYRMKHK